MTTNATTSSGTTTSLDPSEVALTTVFTPASTCSGLTFSAPSYSVWYNEPVPAPSVTESGCYPSQWLNGYTSLSTSSVAVALNPLVCPSGWTTALNSTSSYVACCPTGYNVHPPDTLIDPQRPAYGGLCFSAFDAGASLTVVLYNTTGVLSTETQTVPFSVSGQVFAHIIDGYATRHVDASTSTSSQSSGQSSASSQSSSSGQSSSHSHHGLSGGAIAGVVVGVVVGVLALLAMGFYVLRRRKQKYAAVAAAEAVEAEEAHGTARHESGATPIHEIGHSEVAAEKDGFPKASRNLTGTSKPSELSAGSEVAYEMSSPPVAPEPAELETTHHDEYFPPQR